MSVTPAAVAQAQDWIRAHLAAPRYAIDATAGNGHDTVFLARRVGDTGRVWALDVQEPAIVASGRRLEESGLRERATLVSGDHAVLRSLIPEPFHGEIDVVMFNLGYLPGGDKTRVTTTGSTLRALAQARDLLRPGGCLTVVAYAGHPGGKAEAEAVEDWFRQSEHGGHTVHFGDVRPASIHPPRAYCLLKR